MLYPLQRIFIPEGIRTVGENTAIRKETVNRLMTLRHLPMHLDHEELCSTPDQK
jgi:hypothetical protein